MPKGGARVRSGPSKDPDALRRDRDEEQWVELPPEREGEPPPWPLSRQSARENVLWAREWRRPQAVMWERYGLEDEVAHYVRQLRLAESPKAGDSARRTLMMMRHNLGLTVKGMSDLQWRWFVARGQAAQHGSARRATGTEGPTARDRLKVLDGGDA